ncbi:MAG: ATP-binding protein [Candidatus Melainabacteria bacterium]|jgi:SpoVK/Ycf46/Vps4 family AAA+-type ATPase|nr:MAG: ATP-binding protein [Candidatus Melainabacteria bacterium]
MRGSLLRKLLQAYAEGDRAEFEKAAMQLASSEKEAGHVRLAEELRNIIAKITPEVPIAGRRVVDLAQPREELAGLLDGGYSEEKLKDIVLTDEMKNVLMRVLRENKARTDLESWGVGATRKLLFFGNPGCGKTLAANVLAGELGLPILTVRLDGLFSRFLGATANHLKVIFEEMNSRPAVYLFDEFDALGKTRDDSHDIGELRRVVTSFLQLMDADRSNSLIVAATNNGDSLDKALLRRFDRHVEFPLPTLAQVAKLIALRLAIFEISEDLAMRCAQVASGMSFADCARACDDSIRTMALEKRRTLSESDLLESFHNLKIRLVKN